MNHYEFSQKGGRSKSIKKQESGRMNAEKARQAKAKKAELASAKDAGLSLEP